MNMVDVHISYVRSNVNIDCCTRLIRSIRGVGYVLAAT